MRRLFLLFLLAIVLGSIVFAGTGTSPSTYFPHPSFGDTSLSPEKVKGLIPSLQKELAMPESDLVRSIEPLSMAYWVGCPNCEGGFQGGILRWTPDDPKHVFCAFCKMTFPNDKYPEDKAEEYVDSTGTRQHLKYYEDSVSKQRYHFSAKVRNGQFIHLLGVLYNFARMYAATGEEVYSRRAALLLNRMAEVYPHLLPHAGLPYDGGPSRFTDLSIPHEYYSGKIHDWWYAEIPWQCAEAYDLIYGSGELERLAAELKLDVKARIEKDLLRRSVEFVLEFNSLLSNAEINTMASMVAVGRAIGEPRYIHEAIHRAKALLDWHFFRDGMWMEFSEYHLAVVVHYQRLMRAISGYSDPPDYVDAQYSTHFDHFNPQTEFPILNESVASYYRMFQPDGYPPSIGDSEYMDRIWPEQDHCSDEATSPVMVGPCFDRTLPPKERTVPGLLPGVGYAWLATGENDRQFYAGFNFCETAGHTHADGLNLSIHAFGHQLLPDLGYTHTKMRWWTWGTLPHNTVMVNGQMQYFGEAYETAGDLILFDVDNPSLQVVEASNERRYNTEKNHLVDLFRRLVVLCEVEKDHPILLDIFRVLGGKRHEWLAHGPVYQPFRATVSVPMKARPGTLLGEDKTYQQAVAFLRLDGHYDAEQARKLAGDEDPRYGFIHSLRQGDSDQGWKLTFSPEQGDQGPFLDLHMVGGQARQLILGSAPSVVPAKENDEIAAEPQMPILLVRRQSDSKLSSVFPAVWEAHTGTPQVQDITRLTIEHGNDLDVAFLIHCRGGKQILLVSLYNPDTAMSPRTIVSSTEKLLPVTFAGDLLVASIINDQWNDLTVWNCRSLSLSKPQFEYSGKGKLTGEVSQVIRRHKTMQLRSLDPLPEKVKKGTTLLVRWPDGKQEGFPIERWDRSADNAHFATALLEGDPGIDGNPRAGTCQRLTYPQKIFPPVTYTGTPWSLSTKLHCTRNQQGQILIKEEGK